MSVRWPLALATLSLSTALGVGAQPLDNRLPGPLQAVGIDQRLGAQVPLDLRLMDATGGPVELGALLTDRPAILILAYYRCPMLCSVVLDGVVRALRAIPIEPGHDFDLITVSFDPRDDAVSAAAIKAEMVGRDGRPATEAAWHFLTGSETAVSALAEAVGFRYRYDPETDQFAHASAIMVLTPEGRVARYFYGIEYPPRDLRLSLVEAAGGAIGTLSDQVLLFCFQYDPETGRYSLAILRTLRMAGVVTVGILGFFMTVMLRRERRARARAGGASSVSPPTTGGR